MPPLFISALPAGDLSKGLMEKWVAISQRTGRGQDIIQTPNFSRRASGLESLWVGEPLDRKASGSKASWSESLWIRKPLDQKPLGRKASGSESLWVGKPLGRKAFGGRRLERKFTTPFSGGDLQGQLKDNLLSPADQ